MLKYNQIKLTYVVQIYNEQHDFQAFNRLVDTYSAYDKSLLKHIHFIFVDDCSPVSIVLPKDCKLNYTLAKVITDITWNQGGARNLGVHLAKSQKLVVTDLDHLFPEETLTFLTQTKIPDAIFVFKRLQNNKAVETHYNTFYLSKSTFFKVLGIDEEFCGHYGHEDVFFLDMQRRLGTKLLKYRDYHVHAFEHKNTDKAQHHLIRDEEPTRALYDAKRRILFDDTRDPFEAHSRLFLNFEWAIIEEKMTL